MTDRPASLTTPLAGYADWLSALKARIHTAQQRAALAVNRELVLLYWQIGRDILERQSREGWGAKVLERLSRDLREAFPEMKGFSSRNLKYMRYFAEHCPAQQFGQQAAAQIALVPHRDPADQAGHAGRARVVCRVRDTGRLVAHHTGNPHQEPPVQSPRPSGHEFQCALAIASLGFGAGHPERSLSVGFPRVCRQISPITADAKWMAARKLRALLS